MRGLRALCAVLLFVAIALGVSLRSATAHGMAHRAGGAAQDAAAVHVHSHAHERPCRDCPAKAGCGTLCQMACCTSALAVLDQPVPSLGMRLAHAVRFVAGPPASARGATVAPDPFPPKPSRIA